MTFNEILMLLSILRNHYSQVSCSITNQCLLVFASNSSTAQNNSCREGSVRLVQTRSITLSNAGLVEVCLNGVWGTVCADSLTTPWSEKNAQVLCKQLGYSGALNSILQDTWVELHVHSCNTYLLCVLSRDIIVNNLTTVHISESACLHNEPNCL